MLLKLIFPISLYFFNVAAGTFKTMHLDSFMLGRVHSQCEVPKVGMTPVGSRTLQLQNLTVRLQPLTLPAVFIPDSYHISILHRADSPPGCIRILWENSWIPPINQNIWSQRLGICVLQLLVIKQILKCRELCPTPLNFSHYQPLPNLLSLPFSSSKTFWMSIRFTISVHCIHSFPGLLPPSLCSAPGVRT